MPSALTLGNTATAFGLGTLLSAVVAAFALARASGRRARITARRDAEEMLVRLGAFLQSQESAKSLRRAVRAAPAPTFWSALETFSIGIDRPGRDRLSRALERNPHSATERRALLDDSPWRRELAARRLALIAAPASRRALRSALPCGPEFVTLAAAAALARDRDLRALRWIVRNPAALRNRSDATWTGLLRAFGRRSHPFLLDTIEHRTIDAKLARAIIETLGLARFRPAARAVVRYLTHDALDVRVAAARALGRLEAIEFGYELAAALESPDWQVRAQAARALGRAGATGSTAALAKHITDRSWWVRRHAAYALAELGNEGVAALRRVATASPDPYARDIAKEVLEVDGIDLARIAS